MNGLEKVATSTSLVIVGRVAGVVALPILGVVWSIVWNNQVETKNIAADVKVLTAVVNVQLSGVYHATEAQRDLSLRDARLDVMKDRLDGIINRLENHSRRLEVVEMKMQPGKVNR
jgi:ferredoxin-fold anticodon binding domain-containing protein